MRGPVYDVESGAEYLIPLARKRLAQTLARTTPDCPFLRVRVFDDGTDTAEAEAGRFARRVRIRTTPGTEFFYIAPISSFCPCLSIKVFGEVAPGGTNYTFYAYWSDGVFISSWAGAYDYGPGGVGAQNIPTQNHPNAVVLTFTSGPIPLYSGPQGSTPQLSGSVLVAARADQCRPVPLSGSLPGLPSAPNPSAYTGYGAQFVDTATYEYCYNPTPTSPPVCYDVTVSYQAHAPGLGGVFENLYKGLDSRFNIWNPYFDTTWVLANSQPYLDARAAYQAAVDAQQAANAALVAETALYAAQERQRLLTCSESVTTLLLEGVIHPNIFHGLKAYFTPTAYASPGVAPLGATWAQTVSTVDEVLLAGPDGPGNKRTITITREVYLRYVRPGEEDETIVTVRGTATVVIYKPTPGSAIGVTVTTTNNFPMPDGQTVPELPFAASFGERTLFSWFSPGQNSTGDYQGPTNRTNTWLRVANGVSTSVSSSVIHIGGGVYQTFNYVFTTGGTVSSGYLYTFTAVAPAASIALSVPTELNDFYLLAAPVVQATGPNPLSVWLSTYPADGEVVTIVPLVWRHESFGMLGVSPQTEDLADASKLQIAVVAAADYRYSYADKTFTFVRARALYDHEREPPPDDSAGAAYYETDEVAFSIPTGFSVTPQVVFISHDARYTDTRAQGETQKLRLNPPEPDPSSPTPPIPPPILTANEEVFLAVYNALNPPE